MYISDEVLAAVHAAAEIPLRDALDLAYLTGQRLADTLKMSRADIVDRALVVKQNKTGTKVRVSIEGDLAELIERIKSRNAMSLNLISSTAGTPLSRFELRGAFSRARIEHARPLRDDKAGARRAADAAEGRGARQHRGRLPAQGAAASCA